MTWGAVWAEDDYMQLLRRGGVQRELDEAEHAEWRAEMRKRARADRLRIRTFAFPPPASMVLASLVDRPATAGDMQRARRVLDEFRADQRED